MMIPLHICFGTGCGQKCTFNLPRLSGMFRREIRRSRRRLSLDLPKSCHRYQFPLKNPHPFSVSLSLSLLIFPVPFPVSVSFSIFPRKFNTNNQIMEENHVAAFESIANGDQHDAASTVTNNYNNTHHTHANNDHDWQKVTAKRSRKKKESNAKVINIQNKVVPGIANANGNGVLRLKSDDVAPARSKLRSDDEDGDNSDDEAAAQKGRIARNFH